MLSNCGWYRFHQDSDGEEEEDFPDDEDGDFDLDAELEDLKNARDGPDDLFGQISLEEM